MLKLLLSIVLGFGTTGLTMLLRGLTAYASRADDGEDNLTPYLKEDDTDGA
jgi:hypothetical protein